VDWKLFAITFGSVFLAELGDKTQLATLAFTAESKKPWVVFLASASALVVVTAIGVGAGGAISRVVPAAWIRRGAAMLFIAIGILLLVSEWRKEVQG
jgi:putative Ca2+/H+ antiporter (TMEM165/GDT1 family)